VAEGDDVGQATLGVIAASGADVSEVDEVVSLVMATIAVFGRDLAFVTASMRAKIGASDAVTVTSGADVTRWLAEVNRAKERLDDALLPLWLRYRQQ
jgi:hypothetical protein